MITTTKGLMDESLLEKREGIINNYNEFTRWVEYWHDGELVHRSARVLLKHGVMARGFFGWCGDWVKYKIIELKG